jgi:hypothetical protein
VVAGVGDIKTVCCSAYSTYALAHSGRVVVFGQGLFADPNSTLQNPRQPRWLVKERAAEYSIVDLTAVTHPAHGEEYVAFLRGTLSGSRSAPILLE